MSCCIPKAGKSAYKAIEIATLLTMRCRVVLVTKGKKESQSLAEKLREYFVGSVFEKKIFCVYKHTKEDISSSFADHTECFGCVLVIPDSYQKITRATRIVKKAKKAFRHAARAFTFGNLFDECDVILDRTPDRSQKNEVEMKKLEDLGPVLRTLVTATPLPVVIRHMGIKTAAALPKLATIAPNKDYVGVDAHRVFRNGNGEAIYLDVQSLKAGFQPRYTRVYASKKDNKPLFHDDCIPKLGFRWRRLIPLWNEQCNEVLDSAFSLQELGRAIGLLFLVGTCTRTQADDNIFQQALVQDYYYAKGRQFIAVCVHADKIFYRLPGQKRWFQCSRSRMIDDVIGAIDKDLRFGLKMPIVIFGYHKLKRSISFRSSQRVPTHYIA
jgi:hypothetical protein